METLAQQKSNKQGHRLGLGNGAEHGSSALVAASIARMIRNWDGGKGDYPKMSEILKVSKASQIIGDFNNEQGGCALGILGLEANAVKDGKMDYHKMLKHFEVVNSEMNEGAGKCPECDRDTLTIWGMIPHLNDIHEKSFAQVGEWLETKGL